MEIGTSIQSAKPVVLPSSNHEVDFTPVRSDTSAAIKLRVPATQNVDLQETDKRRMEAIQQAVSQTRDLFAVSDTRFTIFKDASGKFVTRFTSLKDGSVTYFPEPQLLKRLESAGIDTSFIHLNA